MTKTTTTKTEPTWTRASTIAVFMLLAMPLLSLVSALIYQKAWDITLASQYGDGPTLKSWFGISLVVTMLTWRLRPKDDEGPATRESLIKLLKYTVSTYAMHVIFLLFASGTCWVLGW